MEHRLSPEILDKLDLSNILNICRLSRVYEQLCSEYVPSRVKRDHQITLTPLRGKRWKDSFAKKEFEVLAAYESRYLALSDALLRSIDLGNVTMIDYFRRIAEQRHGVNTTMVLILIGSILRDDPGLFKDYYEEYMCKSSEEEYLEAQDFVDSSLPVVMLIAELENEDEIVDFLEEDVEEATLADIITVIPYLLSVDIIEYVRDNADRIFPPFKKEENMKIIYQQALRRGREMLDQVFVSNLVNQE